MYNLYLIVVGSIDRAHLPPVSPCLLEATVTIAHPMDPSVVFIYDDPEPARFRMDRHYPEPLDYEPIPDSGENHSLYGGGNALTFRDVQPNVAFVCHGVNQQQRSGRFVGQPFRDWRGDYDEGQWGSYRVHVIWDDRPGQQYSEELYDLGIVSRLNWLEDSGQEPGRIFKTGHWFLANFGRATHCTRYEEPST